MIHDDDNNGSDRYDGSEEDGDFGEQLPDPPDHDPTAGDEDMERRMRKLKRGADDDTDDRDRQMRRLDELADEQTMLMTEVEQLRTRLAAARVRVDDLGTAYSGRGRPRGTDRRNPDGTMVLSRPSPPLSTHN